MAVGISAWSERRGRPAKTVSAKAWPSWIATGVSATRSVTSPTAKIEGTAVCDQSSTATAPLAADADAQRLEPEAGGVGIAPGGEEHLVDHVRLAVVELTARPASIRSIPVTSR